MLIIATSYALQQLPDVMQDKAAEFHDIDAVVEIDDGKQTPAVLMLSSLIDCDPFEDDETPELKRHEALQQQALAYYAISSCHSETVANHDCTASVRLEWF